MAFYQLSPSPDLSTKEQNYAFWNESFDEESLARIIEIGDTTEQAAGIVSNDKKVDEKIRKSKVAWLPVNEATQFIYETLGFVARQLNGEFFGFDITAFVDNIQYTVYDQDGDHYDWHMDKGMINTSPRKLSMVLQLSDPADYEGGDLEFFLGSDVIKAEKKRGMIYAFPSYIVHRVTPVTSGVRKSLVAWIAGPKFR